MLQNNYENQKTQYKITKTKRLNTKQSKMQKETGINEQTNNCILNPYNLLTRGLRLSTK